MGDRPRATGAQNKATDRARKIDRREIWWVWEDLNLRPYAYQAYALTT